MVTIHDFTSANFGFFLKKISVDCHLLLLIYQGITFQALFDFSININSFF